MGQALMVLAAYLLVGILQMMPLVRQKIKKHIITYLVFWVLSTAFSLLLVLKVKLPSFERAMIELITSITGGGGV